MQGGLWRQAGDFCSWDCGLAKPAEDKRLLRPGPDIRPCRFLFPA